MVIFAAWATCVVKSILKDPQAPYGQWNCAKNIRPCYVLKSSFSSHSRGGGSVYRHVHIVYPVKGGVMGGGGGIMELCFRPQGFGAGEGVLIRIPIQSFVFRRLCSRAGW